MSAITATTYLEQNTSHENQQDWIVDEQYQSTMNENNKAKAIAQAEMLKDFHHVFGVLSQEEQKSSVEYIKKLKWAGIKSYWVSLNKVAFFPLLGMFLTILNPAFAIFGIIGGFILFRTLVDREYKRSKEFYEIYDKMMAHYMTYINKPDVIKKWVNEFLYQPLGDEDITLLRDIIHYIPDHPLLMGLAKAHKGVQHGINIKYAPHEISEMLNDGREKLGMLKQIQTLRNNVCQIRTQNPQWNLPTINNPRLQIYLNQEASDQDIISLRYDEIAYYHREMGDYWFNITQLGMKTLALD